MCQLLPERQESGYWGRSIRPECRPDSGPYVPCGNQIEKDEPQPQVDVALGFCTTN